MSVSANLIKAVSERDMQTIRDCLAACIVFDPNMTRSFPDSLQYCHEHGIAEAELYEKHDGRNLECAETTEAFSTLCAELGTNFSRERIEAIRRLGRKLHPVSDATDAQACSGRNAGMRTSGNSILLLWGFAVAGVVVGGVVGGLLLRKAIVGAVVGGIAGAAVGSMCGKKKTR